MIHRDVVCSGSLPHSLMLIYKKSDNKLLLLNDSKHDEPSVSDCCSDSYSEDLSNLTSSGSLVRAGASLLLSWTNKLCTLASKTGCETSLQNYLNFKTRKSCKVASVNWSQPVHVYQPNWAFISSLSVVGVYFNHVFFQCYIMMDMPISIVIYVLCTI